MWAREKKRETGRGRTQGPLKKTARVGTLKPHKTARVRTLEENSLEKDTSNFEGRSHQVERWRVPVKRKEEKWKKRKKKKKKVVLRSEMVEKVQKYRH